MIEFFLNAYKDTPVYMIVLEAIAFVFGILSVYLAKKENIWVYPTGLIATVITVYLFYNVGYFGDAIVNVYYSIMSFYGWFMWSRTGKENVRLEISRVNNREILTGLGIFVLTIFVIYGIYNVFGYEIKIENYLDIFTSGIFFTAMWYMALKKVESWILWIVGDVISIPLCLHRELGMLALQYLIFTILAVQAFVQWKKILNSKTT